MAMPSPPRRVRGQYRVPSRIFWLRALLPMLALTICSSSSSSTSSNSAFVTGFLVAPQFPLHASPRWRRIINHGPVDPRDDPVVGRAAATVLRAKRASRRRRSPTGATGLGTATAVSTTDGSTPVGSIDDASPLHPLLSWLGALPSAPGAQQPQLDSIELRPSELGDGIGGYATKTIGDGDVVFSVPAESFVSVSAALAHPRLGPQFRRLWRDSPARGDSSGSAVLAGLLAHLQLNSNTPDTRKASPEYLDRKVYLDMLPREGPGEKHGLWWSAAEVEMLRGTTAHDALVELRDDVNDSIAVLTHDDTGVLADDVAAHGREAVEAAVRAGFVSVLSRSYGVHSTARGGRDYKTLIPLLDALNHREPPNVRYSFEGRADEKGMEGLLVARAVGRVEGGAELNISYGRHPAHIFAAYYGFVPAEAEVGRSYAALKLGAYLNCTTLAPGGIRGRGESASSEPVSTHIPASIVLQAQKDIEEDEYDHSDLALDDWKALCESQPTAAFAALLDGRSPVCGSQGEVGEHYMPLVFGMEDYELQAMRRTSIGGEGEGSLVAMRLCARLCSTASDTDRVQVVAELGRLLSALSNGNDIGNDADADAAAARLICTVAQSQLGELERQALHRDEGEGKGKGGNSAGVARPDVVLMARFLVRSEAALLGAL